MLIPRSSEFRLFFPRRKGNAVLNFGSRKTVKIAMAQALSLLLKQLIYYAASGLRQGRFYKTISTPLKLVKSGFS